jgi:transposase
MYYCGLDVSLRETAICIVDAEGKSLKEAKVASDPDAIARTIMDSGYIN